MADQEVVIKISAKNLTGEEFARARQEIAGLGDAAKGQMEKIGASTIAMGELMAKGFEMGLEGMKKVLEFLPELIEHTVKFGAELYTTSLRTGASVENLSKLQYVAKQTNVDFGAMTNSMFKLTANLGGVGEEAKKANEALGRLGLNMQQVKNLKPDEAFITVLSALEKIPNRADQARIGMDLFGKGFKEMANITQEGFTQLMKEAEDLGLVMDTHTAAAAKRAEDAMQAFQAQIQMVGIRIGSAFLPALATVTKMLSEELNRALKESGVTTKDLENIVVGIVETLLQWADVGASVAQVLYVAFNEIKAAINNVVGTIVELGEAFVGLLNMAAQLATKVPGIGDQFKGIAGTLQYTKDVLNSVKAGFYDVADGAKKSTDSSGAFFDQVHKSIGNMSRNFKEELGKTNAEIDHLAEVSKKAGGAAGQAVGFVTEETKKFLAAQKEIESAGESWVATIDMMDAGVADYAKSLLDAGVGQQAVATYLGLTDTQVKALTKSLQVEKEINKEAAQEAEERRKKDLEVLKKLDEEREKAYMANNEMIVEANEEADDAIRKATLNCTDYQIAQIARWQDYAEGAIDYNESNWEEAYNAIQRLAKEKMDEVRRAGDPVFQAWKDLNKDMRGEWATTWEKVLAGEASVTEALTAPFKTMMSGVKKMFAGLLADLEQMFFAPLQNALKQVMGNLMNGLQGMMSGQGGQGFGGLGSSLMGMMKGGAGKALGGGLALSGGMDILQNGLGFMNGAQTGAGIGMMFGGPMGAGIGAGIGLAAAGIGKLLNIGGPSKEEKEGRAVVGDFEKQLATTLSAQQKLEAGGESWKMTTIAVRDAYLATGRSAQEAEAAVKKLWSSSKGGAEAAKKAAEEINSVLGEQKQDEADLEAAVQKYGFSIEELGPKMKKQQLDQMAVGLENDFRLLVNSGIDVGTVITHMSGEMNKYIQTAMKAGQELPAEMKPMVEKMIEMGQLTDENGNKITSLDGSGIKFSETMTQGFDRIVKKFDELIGKIMGTKSAIDGIPKDVDINVNGRYNPPDIPNAEAPEVPGFADEAYVRRPTVAMIGDVAGGEFVLRPSTIKKVMADAAAKGAAAGGGQGGGHTVNVTINTVTSNPEQVRQLVYKEIGPRIIDWLSSNKGNSQTDLRAIMAGS